MKVAKIKIDFFILIWLDSPLSHTTVDYIVRIGHYVYIYVQRVMQEKHTTFEILPFQEFLLKHMIELCYAIFSVIMSKKENQNRITPCDHIRSFNRGHPSYFNFEIFSLLCYQMTVRVGVLLLGNKRTRSLYGTKIWCQIWMVL